MTFQTSTLIETPHICEGKNILPQCNSLRFQTWCGCGCPRGTGRTTQHCSTLNVDHTTPWRHDLKPFRKLSSLIWSKAVQDPLTALIEWMSHGRCCVLLICKYCLIHFFQRSAITCRHICLREMMSCQFTFFHVLYIWLFGTSFVSKKKLRFVFWMFFWCPFAHAHSNFIMYTKRVLHVRNALHS